MVYLSAVSVWDIAVEKGLGKLEIAEGWEDELAGQGFRPLPITWSHALEVGRLPDIHRDSLDRLLVAHAREDGLTLVTRDSAIAAYGQPVVRA